MRQHDNEEYYKTLEKELASDHEHLISQCINELINNRDLDKWTGQLLRPTNLRAPIFYFVPKINKPNNPAWPVVSSVNSHAEKISAYWDKFLRPLAENLKSHIKDTCNFIIRLKRLGRVPGSCSLVTLHVSSLYTNTDSGDRLMEEEPEKTSKANLRQKH